MIRFDVTDDHEDGCFYEVRVYPNRRAYLAACRRRRPDERHDSGLACCFNERHIKVGPDGEEELAQVGAIYGQVDRFGTGVVSHEATHAALNLYRVRHRGVAAFGRNLTPDSVARDEELCRSVGALTTAIVAKGYDLGLWKDDD